MSDEQDAMRIYNSIREYCETYNIPREHLVEILEDQKVLPMIRGKATEYIGAAVLRQVLDPRDWLVEKLNLNPQPGTFDADISITYRRTGTRFSAETKNAVRGGFRLGKGVTSTPYFAVKCHRSRSNRVKKHNDKYMVGEFDVLLCNVSNAIFRGGSLDRGLSLIDNDRAISWLKDFYGVDTTNALIRKTYDDWRICLPATIALDDGTIPRCPRVLMENDPNWFGLNHLAPHLRTLLNGH